MTTNGISESLLKQLNPAPGAGDAVNKRDQLDKTAFLTLFVAQLQNQDPLSPMEPNELTSQLAQLSGVEQLTAVNQRLDALTATTKSNYGASLLSLIGKDVRFDVSDLSVEDGRASRVAYKLAGDAQAVKATVRNAAGEVVREVELGDVTSGSRVFAWDGKDQRGRAVSDGKYNVKLTATVGGQRTGVALEAEGAVDGVDLSSDPPVLVVGGTRLTIDRVRQVRSPQQAS